MALIEAGIQANEVAVSLEVIGIPGIKHYPTGWAFESRDHSGMHVLGTTEHAGRRWRIKAGVDPKTGNNIRHDVLVHEMCHYLIEQVGIYEHDPRIQGVFGWSRGAAL